MNHLVPEASLTNTGRFSQQVRSPREQHRVQLSGGNLKADRAARMLVRYIRGDNRQPIGVLVGTRYGVGWSVAAPRDRVGQFDRDLGRHIAVQRMFKGTRARLPDFATTTLNEFVATCERFFFEQPQDQASN